MRDIGLIKQVAELLSGNDFGKRYDLVSLAAEFSTALQAELAFTQEARYTEALRENLLVAVLDCGMMGRIDKKTQAALVEMIIAIISSDAQRCTQITLQLAEPMGELDLSRLEWDYDSPRRGYANDCCTNIIISVCRIWMRVRHSLKSCKLHGATIFLAYSW